MAWRPYNTAPKTGQFLILFKKNRKVCVCERIETFNNSTGEAGPPICVIDNLFDWDLGTPDLWHPLPPIDFSELA